MFRVGQKVVCVDAGTRVPWGSAPMLREKQIYTITRVFSEFPSVEVAGATAKGSSGFWSDRFRPLVEKKTDISIFTTMLNPSKRRVDAEA